MHLDERGLVADAVKQFQRAGGTGMLLVHKPHLGQDTLPLKVLREPSPAGYLSVYDETLRLADVVRECGVKVRLAVGPYPVKYTRMLEEGFTPEEGHDRMMGLLEAAVSLVEEGKAHAIGEVGRPHFPVNETVWDASNDILTEILDRVKGVGCPVILHTESADPSVFADLARMADRVGFDKDRLVKHFAPPLVEERENAGLLPSVMAYPDACIEAASKGDRFLLETDYLDDPNRPGSVLGPKTVPKRSKKFYRDGVFSEELMHRIHADLPMKLYGE